MGLSAAFGLSRQAVNQWMLAHPGHATTEFIHRYKDIVADILTNASLYGSANAIAVIFTLKNHFEHVDRVDIAPVTNMGSDEEYDADAIRRRYIQE
jgi:thioredoxin reductase